MLRSPAYRALSLSGHRILARIEIELASHGGKDNGKLPVTHADFRKFRHRPQGDRSAAFGRSARWGLSQAPARLRWQRRTSLPEPLFELTYLPTAASSGRNRRVADGSATIEEAEKIAAKARAEQDQSAMEFQPASEQIPAPLKPQTHTPKRGAVPHP